MTRELRDYQQAAKDAVQHAYHGDGLRRVGIGLFTGAGKTDVFCSVTKDVYDRGNKTVILVHRDVLVEQTSDRLKLYVPERAIGIVRGRNNDVDAPVIVASIQTLARPGRLTQIRPPNLTIVDEAHVSVSGSYHAYYQHVDAVPGGQGYMLGVTATWMRSDKIGLGDVWEKVVYKKSIKWGVDNGHIVRPKALQIGGSLDLSDVRTVKNPDSPDFGDYNSKDLQDVVMVEDLLETVIRGYYKFAASKPAVLFGPTQASVRYFLEGLQRGIPGEVPGISTGEILASTTKAARAWNHAGFANGAIKVLGTVAALGVGWDAPHCGTMICIKPTRSLVTFTQEVGRILRPWPGKSCGLILDAVGVTDDKVLASVVDLSLTPEKREYVLGDDSDDEDGETADPREHVAKKIHETREVDLFAGTEARWLLTDKGVPFVQTRDHTYFIGRLDGLYAVGRCGKTRQGAVWLARDLSSEDALSLGSEWALEEDPSIVSKSAPWRSQARPTPEQMDYAQRLGILVNGQRRSELSDQISIKVVSGLLASVQGG